MFIWNSISLILANNWISHTCTHHLLVICYSYAHHGKNPRMLHSKPGFTVQHIIIYSISHNLPPPSTCICICTCYIIYRPKPFTSFLTTSNQVFLASPMALHLPPSYTMLCVLYTYTCNSSPNPLFSSSIHHSASQQKFEYSIEYLYV